MQVAIIKYNAGNIYSVDCALKRVGVDAVITDDEEVLKSSDKIIFPGVGEAAFTQPVLGICIGMQLMCRHSEEGDVDCLNIFDVDVKRFCPMKNEKIPHMGWNSIERIDSHMFPVDLEGKYVYFVHSYYVPECEYTTAVTDYIQPFSAALHKDNFYATQFHLEKSGKVGESILTHFLNL